jgi:eukaryotic-like serine/threonine-protein kinase
MNEEPQREDDEPIASGDFSPNVPNEGDIIDGKYLVGTVIGEGGMGVVLSGEHMQLRQPIAIKVLAPKYAADRQFRARFLREARAAASLSSDHAVRIIDVGTTAEKLPFMVMERLEGESLESRLERGPLSVSMTLDTVAQALSAIADAHARGLVHRDLKPGNLFLTPKDDGNLRVKVLDFGISKSMLEVDASASDASLTAPRALLGSPLYMSPEQLRDASGVDARTDVWAMGVVIFELLSGRAPFETNSIPELYAKILNEPTPSLRALVPNVSFELEAVVTRCLEKERSRRFSDAADLARAIDRLRSPDQGAVAETVPVGSSPVPRVARRRPVVALGTAVFALALLAMGYRGVFGTPAPAPFVAPSASNTGPRTDSLPSPELVLPPTLPTVDSGPTSKVSETSPPPGPSAARPVGSAQIRVRGLKQIKLIE